MKDKQELKFSKDMKDTKTSDDMGTLYYPYSPQYQPDKKEIPLEPHIIGLFVPAIIFFIICFISLFFSFISQ